jgi:hypothetical protein
MRLGNFFSLSSNSVSELAVFMWYDLLVSREKVPVGFAVFQNYLRYDIER